MKYLNLLFMAVFVCSCSTVGHLKNNEVAEVIENKAIYDKKEISLTAYLLLKQNDATVLYGKDSDDFLDVVYVGESDLALTTIKKGKKYCVVVKGIFKEYNADFVGLGHLTSKHGIVEAEMISFCNGKTKAPIKIMRL